ncbi:MAG: TrkA family potassium uptake protein [Dehalococcoidia bacterium]|nr:TrkA family potassium uptake protein [Dehalococcoidia bacterium]
MKVVILGCARVGAWLAAELHSQGHHVRILDEDEENFRRLPVELRTIGEDGGEGIAVLGDGTQEEDLIRAGIEGADVFVATLPQDTPNLMAAQIAQHVFHVPRVVCRLNDGERQGIYQGLGLHVINATQLVGEALMSSLREP